jgi:hypothetical protein
MKFGSTLTVIAVLASFGISVAQKPPKMTHSTAGKSKTSGMTMAQWQKWYDQGAKMFDKMDVNGLTSMMTPDCTMTMDGKTTNMDQSKQMLQQWFGMMKNLHCKMTVTKVVNGKNGTMVTDSFVMSGMTKADPAHKMKAGKLVDKGTETATWVQMNGKWMMKKMVGGKHTMTMNGKPFMPKM